MKTIMHVDEDDLDEVMKVTRGASKTEAVAMALNEMARQSRLKTLLSKGSGVQASQLDKAYDSKSFAMFRVTEDQAPRATRRSRR